MKKYKQPIIIAIILLIIISFVYLILNPKQEEKIAEVLPNVRVMEIATSSNQEQMKFVGFIQPKQTYQGTFSTVGTINEVAVVNGQIVKKGTLLATIEDENAQTNLNNAQQSYNSALSNQKQAKSLMDAEATNLQSEKDNYQARIDQAQNDIEKLEVQKTEALEELEKAKEEFGETSLEAIEAEAKVNQLTVQIEANKELLNDLNSEQPASISIAQSRYEAAVSAYEASTNQTVIAQNGVKAAQQQIEQTKLLSQIDGTVVAVLQQEGDLATPIMPSVVVASNEKVAVFGLSQSNVNLVVENMVAQVISETDEFEGFVSDVSFLPDETSRTYEAKVDVGFKEDLNIGETVEIIVELQETEGIWIDLNLLKNDGQDYVYVIQANRINKRIVERLSMQKNLGLVKNLQKGDLVVVEGYRNLKVGDEVNVVGEIND